MKLETLLWKQTLWSKDTLDEHPPNCWHGSQASFHTPGRFLGTILPAADSGVTRQLQKFGQNTVVWKKDIWPPRHTTELDVFIPTCVWFQPHKQFVLIYQKKTINHRSKTRANCKWLTPKLFMALPKKTGDNSPEWIFFISRGGDSSSNNLISSWMVV